MSCKAKQMRDSSDVSLSCKLEEKHEGPHQDSKLGEWAGQHDPTCECPICHERKEKEKKAAAEKAKELAEAAKAAGPAESDAALHTRVEAAVDETLAEMEAKEKAAKQGHHK